MEYDTEQFDKIFEKYQIEEAITMEKSPNLVVLLLKEKVSASSQAKNDGQLGIAFILMILNIELNSALQITPIKTINNMSFQRIEVNPADGCRVKYV